MRLVRKLVLLAVMAAAAMALSASSASAQGVEISDESGAHCGPCVVTADSVLNAGGFTGTAIIAMVGGMEINTGVCDDEFDATITEDGIGHLTNQQLHNGPTCAKQPCESSGPEAGDGHEWDISIYEDGAGFAGEVTYCVLSGGVPRTCHLDDLIVTEIDHHVVIDAPHSTCEPLTGQPILEVLGRWELNEPLEIDHA